MTNEYTTDKNNQKIKSHIFVQLYFNCIKKALVSIRAAPQILFQMTYFATISHNKD